MKTVAAMTLKEEKKEKAWAMDIKIFGDNFFHQLFKSKKVISNLNTFPLQEPG